ncbi:hypothetical protein AGMMS49940_04260 [Spirochaetia bacterium]|nr:hypothetical protein AGMMS49940_04260 [Spirochaetia bacterium]
MKQTICALLLVFSAALVFPQTRADTFVYVMVVSSGPPAERGVIQQNLRAAVRTLGFFVTENSREADYLINCSIIGSSLPVMTLSLLNPRRETIDSADLVFTNPEGAYARFPTVLQSLFDGQPLRQRPAAQGPVNGVSAAPGTAGAAVQGSANGVSGAPGTAGAAAQGPANGVSGAPGTAGTAAQGPVNVNVVVVNQAPANGVSGASGTAGAAAQGPANRESAAPGTATEGALASRDAWKYKWLFLNARIGVSNRYFLTKAGELAAIMLTGEAGVETEFHFFNFFALQFGLNYAMDWDPRNSTIVNSTNILSIPLMVKFIFNTSPATTLGLYGGGYGSFTILGPITPPPFGILAGVDTAIKAGPGAVLFDIRYSADLGTTDPHDAAIAPYQRMFLTFSAGYKLGMIPRKARARR